MYLYFSWKLNLETENKLEIIRISNIKEPNIKYHLKGQYFFGHLIINEYLDLNTIYHTRISVKNPNEANNFTLYFIVRDIVKDNNVREVLFGVFSNNKGRTRCINEDMRYAVCGNDESVRWTNEKLNILKRDKIIQHPYMYNSQMTIKIFDFDINL